MNIPGGDACPPGSVENMGSICLLPEVCDMPTCDGPNGPSPREPIWVEAIDPVMVISDSALKVVVAAPSSDLDALHLVVAPKT